VSFYAGHCEELFFFDSVETIEEVADLIYDRDDDSVWIGWSGEKDGGEHLALKCVRRVINERVVVEGLQEAYCEEIGEAAEFALIETAGDVAALGRTLVAATMQWLRSVDKMPDVCHVPRSDVFKLGRDFSRDESGAVFLTDTGRRRAETVRGEVTS